jgi:hypothetical protein
MVTKRILVLANSVKHYPNTCVAGREILEREQSGRKYGGWIRPVSNHDEGAVSISERRLVNGTDPTPFDIIHVPCSTAQNNPLQPENWLIQAGQTWSPQSRADPGVLAALLEKPVDLWFEPGQKSDRASEGFLRRLSSIQSLYLIRPENFQIEIRSRVWEGYAKKQRRGVFAYHGKPYDFALTDPPIGRKYFPCYPRTPDGHIQIANPGGVCFALV